MLKIGVLKDVDLSGRWQAIFYVGKEQKYTEIIELRYRVGLLIGKIVNDDRNYDLLKNKIKNPLRVKGCVNDNRYFTGFWYHPIETYRNHGSYQMLIYPNAEKMEGQWIGFSETSHIISHGKWVWLKL